MNFFTGFIVTAMKCSGKKEGIQTCKGHMHKLYPLLNYITKRKD